MFTAAAKSDSANRQTVEEFKTNRYDAATDTLTFTEAQTSASSTTSCRITIGPSSATPLRAPGSVRAPSAIAVTPIN